MNISFEKIPKGIRDKPVFCLAKLELKDGKSKADKIPYTVDGFRASPGNVTHFTTLSKVKEKFAEGGYQGIGIGLFEDLVAIDIDDCVVGGEVNKFAKGIIDKVKSYTEISISGKGIHILARVPHLKFNKERYYFKNSKIGLEVYPAGFTKRFILLTGNAIGNHDVIVRTREVQELLEELMVKPTTNVTSNVVATPGSFLSDESVLEKMFSASNGAKAKELWDGGNGDKSASEGDQALCNILAFWCGGDIEQMDRIFRMSSRIRDKWDEMRGADTYGNITLKKAVSFCKEYYKPINSTMAEEDINKLSAIIEELTPEINPRYRNGDLGNGRLLADVYKDIARYVPERKKWFVYDGIRWTADICSLKAMELCKDLADALTHYATTIRDEDSRKAFLKICTKWQQRTFREVYLREAQSVYPVSMDRFDGNRYLLNCLNGTLNLKRKEFREHRADDFITKLSPVNFEPEARSERFDRFIEEIMSNDNDKSKYLQKALGYAISGDTRYECMFFLYGESTRNGKGTLMESILTVFGDYGRAVRPETIAMKSNHNSQNPSEDIARLAGIRFANISEPSRGLLLNAAQVKSMTGNDTLNARFLHENSFDFKPQFKLYVNTNYLPVITDMTLFSSNRVVIIPFDRHFEEWEQDKELKNEFAKEETQSAILNWLVEGYYLLNAEGFKKPKSVVDAIGQYSHESDKISQFAEDRLIEDASSEVRTSSVYEEYRRWCIDNGCFAENSRNFNQELSKFGNVVRKRPQKGGEKTTLLKGYRLKGIIPLR